MEVDKEKTGLWQLSVSELERLITLLREDDFCVLGPTVREQAIVYDEIGSLRDLPQGLTDEQGPGLYRLKKRKDNAFFGYNVGPHSWKKFFFRPREALFSVQKKDYSFQEIKPDASRLALLAVRACELAALSIQDTVFLGGPTKDFHYEARREDSFIIAVNCTQAGKTCFCVSMNTGPQAQKNFDLALTEIIREKEHFFVVEAGSKRGSEFLKKINPSPAGSDTVRSAKNGIQKASEEMGRSLNPQGLKDLLYQSQDHPHWDKVANRCLSCANCTMACPTCFCSSVEDVTDLTGEHTERWRYWASCFDVDFSHTAGGSVRRSVKSRYRQWLTHKLASWQDQFGTSGCVGCGRCITWCPVGIDLTEEVTALTENL